MAFDIAISERDRFMLGTVDSDIVSYAERRGGLGTVVDIGAHVGVFSLSAVEHGSPFVIAIEPSEINYQKLVRNVVVNNLYGKVIPLPFAVTGGDSFTPVGLKKAGGNNGQHSLEYKDGIPVTCTPASINFCTLMRAVQESHVVDVLKMDIEGGEWDIFSGPQETLIDILSKINHVEIELHFRTNTDYFQYHVDDPEGIIAILKDAGFDNPHCAGHSHGIRCSRTDIED